jgi:hypothetical protein
MGITRLRRRTLAGIAGPVLVALGLIAGCGNEVSSEGPATTVAASGDSFFDDLQTSWSADEVDEGPDASGIPYGVEVTFLGGPHEEGDRVATVRYTKVDCSGEWTLKSDDGDTADLAEEITQDEGDDECATRANIRLVRRSQDEIFYDTEGDDLYPATAVLTPG